MRSYSARRSTERLKVDGSDRVKVSQAGFVQKVVRKPDTNASQADFIAANFKQRIASHLYRANAIGNIKVTRLYKTGDL